MTKKINLSATNILLILLLAACTSRPETDLMITNARVITGTGEVIENGSVLIKENRILSVEKEANSAEGSHVINAKGKTVLPGLIDTHVHLFAGARGLSNHGFKSYLENDLPAELPKFLEAGITTVMSAGDPFPHILEIRNDLESGELNGPRLIAAGPLFTAPEGHPIVTLGSKHNSVTIKSESEAVEKIDRVAERKVDAIKIVYDDTGLPFVNQLSSENMGAIIEQANRHNLPTYMHVFDVQDTFEAIHRDVDHFVHTPGARDSSVNRDLWRLMREKNISAVTTLGALKAFVKQQHDAGRKEYAQRVIQAIERSKLTIRALIDDGLIAIGTDNPNVSYMQELQLLAEAGLTPEQIIRAATGYGANHLEISDTLGTLDAGKLADLIVVDGNPLEDISNLQNIEVVVKNGKIVVENGKLIR